MKWIKLEDEHGKEKPKQKEFLPNVAGWYIVRTRTSMGNTHRLDCYWNGKHWSCSNQTVTEWLNEN